MPSETFVDRLTDSERAAVARAPTPEWTSPMLATLTEDYFSDEGWIFERKLDGERVLAFLDAGAVRLRSRNRKDLNQTYPEIVDALEEAPVRSAVLDGEIVAFDGAVTSFARLQGRMQKQDAAAARHSGIPVFYYLFDLLHLDGYDLTALPLRTRKRVLRRAISFADPIRFTPHRNTEGEAAHRDACERGWEGVIAKRADSPYTHGRSRDWLKFKCTKGQELVIGGYTDPRGTREELGALLVGYYDDDDLVYAGKVGTGFDDDTLRRLGEQLRTRRRDTPAFDRGDVPRRGVNWVRPDLVCEVGFTEWTGSGRLRHPRYLGLRDDKAATDVIREEPRSLAPTRSAGGAG